jgi:galactose oxidase
VTEGERSSGGVTRRQLLVRGGAAAGVVVLGGGAAALIADAGEATDPGGGSWGELLSLGDVAPVHASLLPTGEVLMCGTNGGTSGDDFPNFVFDPQTEAPVEVAPMPVPMRERDDTLFCAGHAPLADGRVLEVGGQRPSPELGLRYALIFDRRGGGTGRWAAIEADILGGPSWYPTVTRLADGNMLVISGFIDWGGEVNRTIQLFDPARFDRGRAPWRMLVPHPDVPDVSPTGADYTHVFVLPRAVELEGHARQVVMVGASGEVYFFNHTEPFTDPARRFAIRPNGRRPAPGASDRPAEGASSVMLADGRILIVGGGDEGGEGEAALMSKADIYDPYRDRWRSIETGVARSHPVAVMLPDGTVAVVNGDGSPGDPRKPQIIDPDSGVVTTGPPWPDHGVRGYHNVALLLADGRVLTGSGESSGELSGRPGGPGERTDIRCYSPPYLSAVAEQDRPSIVAAEPRIEYGRSFPIRLEGGPIHRVTLVSPGSMTHSIDMNQRCVVLFYGEAEEGELAITAPSGPSIAPPGDYMLFILRAVDTTGDGSVLVPSRARFVRLGGPTPGTR